MSLFQKSVLNKYLTELDKDQIEKQYNLYKTYFLNTTIQKNIIASKEEEFQEGFLRELFVKVLGYTINPEPDFNLRTELKNEKDSKKADGAIINKDSVLGVIELKSTTTTDLNKIEIQAFNYKNNQKDCRYIITSNFQKIRFYIDNAIDYIEWDLFKLDIENFKLLYLCLAKENIYSNVAATIKKESLTVEENITKQLYKEYSSFRKSLFNNIVELNPNIDKLLLFKKTQKLLDRFLFLFFSEDRMLVPPNSVRTILDDWNILKDMAAYQSLYTRFKLYFGYLNTGHKGKLHEIFAYNGGLFAPDEILDIISIDDAILYEATLRLSMYDYNSDVDVNILGHIFEHSLTEIEELENEIANADKEVAKTTKRKKDGVFYTPKYITKYIVENTVGALCKSKKEELKIVEEDYHSLTKKERKKLIENLEHYKEWLLHLTIVDPACGSGAFLNQALEFLIAEHKFISELEANITGSSIVFDVENSILENNLFGVDVNEESIEIAKLSLWLRTARKGRKLNSLNNNIKCGNSLIDDASVVGDKAFNWQNEFPKIFDKGGFDVVIGNPPYVPTELILLSDKKYLETNYKSAFGRINLYPIFYEKGLDILKLNGILGYITPYTILKNQYYIEARKFILRNSTITQIIDFKGVAVFQDAAVDSIVLVLKKQYNEKYYFNQISNIESFETRIYQENQHSINEIINNEDLSMLVSINDKLINRINKKSIPLEKIVNFSQGVITGDNKSFVTKTKHELGKNVITGSNFNRYFLSYENDYLIYDTTKLHRPRKKELFEAEEKILLRQTGAYPICVLDNEKFYTLDTVHNGVLIDENYSLKFILTMLNSSLMKFLYESQINEVGKVFAQVKIIYINPLPIPQISLKEQIPFIEKADFMLKKNKELQQVSNKFIQLLTSTFENITISSAFKNWYQYQTIIFLSELKKQKINLTLSQQSEWLQYFEEQKQKALSIKNEIDTTDKLIDKMVYELYGLTDDEIKIVEAS